MLPWPPSLMSYVFRSSMNSRASGWMQLSSATDLDEWLPGVSGEGFFAFDTPDHGRLLASWFRPAEPGHSTIAGWARAVEECWWECTQADQYFWFHRLFRRICEADPAPGSDCLLRRLIGHEGPVGCERRGSGSDGAAGFTESATAAARVAQRFDRKSRRPHPDCLRP
jgi:hypothetical protein